MSTVSNATMMTFVPMIGVATDTNAINRLLIALGRTKSVQEVMREIDST